MLLKTLKKRSYFLRSNRISSKLYTPNLIIQKSKNHNDEKLPNFGFTITKKIGTAVVRNKIKRRLKSIIQKLLLKKNEYFDLGFNYILICKKEIVKVSYAKLESEIKVKLKKSKSN